MFPGGEYYIFIITLMYNQLNKLDSSNMRYKNATIDNAQCGNFLIHK